MKKFVSALALTLVLVMTMACLTACGSEKPNTPAPRDSSAELSGEAVKVGVVVPLTGAQAIFGEDLRHGMELAVEKVNAEGGVLGGKLELVIEDDATQAAQSATAAPKLIAQDKVAAIVGTNGSSGSLAMMEVADQYGIPLLVPGASSPLLTNSGSKWISTTCQGDELQIEMLVSYAKEYFGVNKLGLLYSNDDYGVGGYNLTAAAAESTGVDLVAEAFMGDDQNFTAVLSKLKDADVDAVMMWCLYTPGSLICKQISEMGWDVPVFGGAGMVNSAVFELSGDTCDGVMMTAVYLDPDPDSDASQFTATYKERYGNDPSYASVHAYDTICLLASAINTVGSTDAEAVQAQIRSTSGFETLKGPITIEKDTGKFICELRLIEFNTDTHTIDYVDMDSLS